MDKHIQTLSEIAPLDLYVILQARQQIFVVDYNSANLDADGIDPDCLHVSWWSADARRRLVAYLRIVPPGRVYKETAIGRVLTTAEFRGKGYGRAIMLDAMAYTRHHYPDPDIRISAQCIYEDFYRRLGFVPCSAPYLEEGMEHVQMLYTVGS